MAIGFDCGTYNLVCCKRDKKTNYDNHYEVNAFIELPLENRFVFNMMKKAGVPLIERKDANVAYALGEKAVEISYTMPQIELKRPMRAGCLNPKERHAQQVMSIMMHGLIGEAAEPPKGSTGEALYYSVPANAINQDTDADYHAKVLEAIFREFKDANGNKVDAHPINEALALIYAELSHKAWTGVGISFGAGMINLCYSTFGNPNFQFSIVNSGDWIDRQAAKATGETETFINQQKHKLDLNKRYNRVMEAIGAQYEIMIQKTVTEIKRGIEQSGAKDPEVPVDIVIAGGTSKPKGFKELFESTLRAVELPIQIGDIIQPEDPLYSVARGCLIAAENAS